MWAIGRARGDCGAYVWCLSVQQGMCRYATTPARLIRVLKGIARDFEKRVLVSAITRASIGFNINRVFQQQSTLGRRRIYLKKYVGNELRWVAIAGVFLLPRRRFLKMT